MAAGTLVSLHQIARGCGVSYQTAAKWAKAYGWRVERPANRTLGLPAKYDYHAVQADLGEQRRAA